MSSSSSMKQGQVTVAGVGREEEAERLAKENFNLKLRIFYLEERVQKLRSGDSAEESLEDELQEKTVLLQEQQQELDKRNLLLVKARNAISNLQTDLGIAKKTLEKERQRASPELLEQKQIEIDGLDHRLREQDVAKRRLNSEVEELKEQVGEIRSQETSVRQEKDKLAAEVEELRRSSEDLQRRLDLESRSQGARHSREARLNLELKKLKEENEKLMKSLRKSKGEGERAIQSCLQLERKSRDLELGLEREKASAKSLAEENQTLRERCDSSKASSERERETLREKLHEKEDELRKENIDIKGKLAALDFALKEAKATTEKLKRENSSMEQLLQRLEEASRNDKTLLAKQLEEARAAMRSERELRLSRERELQEIAAKFETREREIRKENQEREEQLNSTLDEIMSTKFDRSFSSSSRGADDRENDSEFTAMSQRPAPRKLDESYSAQTLYSSQKASPLKKRRSQERLEDLKFNLIREQCFKKIQEVDHVHHRKFQEIFDRVMRTASQIETAEQSLALALERTMVRKDRDVGVREMRQHLKEERSRFAHKMHELESVLESERRAQNDLRDRLQNALFELEQFRNSTSTKAQQLENERGNALQLRLELESLREEKKRCDAKIEELQAFKEQNRDLSEAEKKLRAELAKKSKKVQELQRLCKAQGEKMKLLNQHQQRENIRSYTGSGKNFLIDEDDLLRQVAETEERIRSSGTVGGSDLSPYQIESLRLEAEAFDETLAAAKNLVDRCEQFLSSFQFSKGVHPDFRELLRENRQLAESLHQISNQISQIYHRLVGRSSIGSSTTSFRSRSSAATAKSVRPGSSRIQSDHSRLSSGRKS